MVSHIELLAVAAKIRCHLEISTQGRESGDIRLYDSNSEPSVK